VGAKFHAFHHINQDKAREMMVFMAESFLKALNDNPKIRPYLKEYPFPSNKFKLRLDFTDKKFASYPDGSIENVLLVDDQVTYNHRVLIPDEYMEGFNRSEILDREPFSKSVELVHGYENLSYWAKFKLWLQSLRR
jgi:hypothetical protein